MKNRLSAVRSARRAPGIQGGAGTTGSLRGTILAICAGISLLVSCADILNPAANGRWNPADPDYDSTTDPDPPDSGSGFPVVTIVEQASEDNAVLLWSWSADIEGCAFRHAVNQDADFAFSAEGYGTETSAQASGADGTWYCWVQALSPENRVSETAVASGVIDTLGPECGIRLRTPETGYYTGALSGNRTVPFSWSVDDDSTVVKYLLQVGNAADLENAAQLEEFETTETDFGVALDIDTAGAYHGYWRVGAEDDDGNVTWSDPRRIRVGLARNDFDGDGFSDIIAAAPSWYSEYGQVRLYKGGSSGPVDYTQYAGGTASQRLGRSVAFIGDYDGDDLSDFALAWNQNTGLVRVFLSTQGGYPSEGTAVLLSEYTGMDFGSAFAGGDFNNDGYDDLVVGAMKAGTNENGRIYLFLGNAEGTVTQSVQSNPGESELLHLGCSLAMGDIDNDGFDDIIAGAAGVDGASPAGCLYIYPGHAGTPDLTEPVILTAYYAVYYGWDVATGDINGDGYADIVVGLSGYDSGSNTDHGGFRVYQGAETISGSLSSVQFVNDFIYNDNWYAGHSVACGDVNGDGLADFLAGSPGRNGTGTSNGAVWLYLGEGASEIAVKGKDLLIDPGVDGAYAGQCVSVAGDIDGDGYDDILYALPGYDGLYTDQGGIGIIWGASAVTQTAWDQILLCETDDEQLGGTAAAGFVYGRTLGRR